MSANPGTLHPRMDDDGATIVKVQEAKTGLSGLLHRVEQGEEFVIARGTTPVARLVPLSDDGGRPNIRPAGFLHFELPESFFDELPESELAAWEGRE